MAEISLCMIVRDEEDVLRRCLESAAPLVDEIIIADTGSKDKTCEIAREFTDQVYHFDWCDDFAAARNFAFSKASKPFCMWLDADDVILPEDQQKFLARKGELEQADVVMMPYHTGFDEAGRVVYTFDRERIVRNSPQYRWQGRIHEVIVPAGRIVLWEAAVTHKKLRVHDPDRNLRIFEAMRAAGEEFSARDQYYYGRELMFHHRIEEAKQVLEAFLSHPEGWVENKISACQDLARCHREAGDPGLAMQAVCRAFLYDIPRPVGCCQLGDYFRERGQYENAIFWYHLALSMKVKARGSFEQPDYEGYIPYLQLCVCYDRLGRHETARRCNRLAWELKPDSEICAGNEAYFQSILP